MHYSNRVGDANYFETWISLSIPSYWLWDEKWALISLPVFVVQSILQLDMILLFGQWEKGRIRNSQVVEHGKHSWNGMENLGALAIGSKRKLRLSGGVMRQEESKRKYSEIYCRLVIPGLQFSGQVFIALLQVLEVQFPSFKWLGVCLVRNFNPEITWGKSIKIYLTNQRLNTGTI